MTSSTDPRRAATADWWAVVVVVAVVAAGCAGNEPTEPPDPLLVSDGRPAMGTVLELSLASRDEAAARQWIAEAFDEVAKLDALLSRFAIESDISRLNRAAGKGPLAVDPLTRDLLDRAQKGSALSHGAFDPSVGPLVELWWEAARAGRLPEPGALEAARTLVGAERIRLLPDGSAELPRTGMSIDLGGIAKGYALDRLAASLTQAAMEGQVERRGRIERAALLSFGQSSAWALGSPPGATRWRLLLRSPSGGWAGVVELRDQAMSMSSSLGQWSEIEGRRFGHVVDPRTGRPLERGLEAAVVAPDATRAEILSTALLVLGEEDGMALVESLEECEAMMVDEGGRVRTTSGWQEATRFEAPGRAD